VFLLNYDIYDYDTWVREGDRVNQIKFVVW
jgi:hypothetical protein